MPDPMNSATFKTIRESIGVSVAFVASRLGLHEQSVWRYEAPDRTRPVPEPAAALILELHNTFELVASHIAADAADGDTITRYSSVDDFEEAHPAMAGWGTAAAGLVTARALDLVGRSDAVRDGEPVPAVAWG